MRLVIIGSGNVAHFFASRWSMHHRIVQVISRNPEHARALAHTYHAQFTTHLHEITPDMDACILAVNDDALMEIAAKLRLSHQLVVHTSGSQSIELLRNVSPNYGVIYPLQTISKNIPIRHPFPLLIESSHAEALQQIRLLAGDISENIQEVNSATRRQYHLIAVFANNFVYHLLAEVKKYCETHGLIFDECLPLVAETLDRVAAYPAFSQQTGPAKRNDQQTIRIHESMLTDEPELQALYTMFTHQIRKRHAHD